MVSSPAHLNTSGAVLAFDFGEKRIGVALGEMSLKMAHPLTTISATRNDTRFNAIAKLIEQWQPTRLVVGLPLHMDGKEHGMTQRCRRFAQQLQGRFRLPTELVDERLSSAEAEGILRDFGRAKRKDRALIDQVASQRILQTYFDQYVAS